MKPRARILGWDWVPTALIAGIILVVAAAWVYQPTRTFASCNPPPLGHVELKPGQVYTCPTRFLHQWSVHTHQGLADILFGVAVFAMVAAGMALGAERRMKPAVP
jgi:hypothetical protein